MNAASHAFPVPRVMPNAAHAFGGIWRLAARRFFTPGYWLTLFGMLLALVVLSIPALPNRASALNAFLPWAGLFYVAFIVPLLAYIFGAGAIRDDLSPGTTDYVLTRPISRAAFATFRFIAQLICAQIDFLFGLLVVLGIGVFHGVPGFWPSVPLLLLAQMIAVVTFSAFGFFVGLLTSRYVIVGLLYVGVVEVGIGNVPTQLNQISLVRQILGIMRPFLADQAGVLTRAAQTSTASTPTIVFALLAFSAALIALSALLFSLREFAGSAARDA
jgi:ABC-type transport system involved in multi-copper enzyme maturation permease subunit